MVLQSGTKYREDGSVSYKESCQVFSIEDKGKGIARGQLSFSRKPYGKRDQALIDAGYKLDRNGYMHGNVFTAFSGAAYNKVLQLGNGAIITDILFENDIYPYVDKDGNVAYNRGVNWMITDFTIKSDNGNSTDTSVATPTDKPNVIPAGAYNPYVANDPKPTPEPVMDEPKEVEEDNPFGY